MFPVTNKILLFLCASSLCVSRGSELCLKDFTLEIFGSSSSWSSQLKPSSEEWLKNLDKFAGLDPWFFHPLAVTDINGDGLDDIFVSQPGGLPNLLFVSQNGKAVDLAPSLRLDLLDKTRSALWADLDNDADQDLILGCASGLAVMENRWPEPFVGKFFLSSVKNASSLAVADFNGDGFLDLVVVRHQSETLTNDFPPIPDGLPVASNGAQALLFRGGPGFSLSLSPDSLPSLETKRLGNTVQAVDLDGDSHPDLVFGNAAGPCLFLRNSSKHGEPITFTTFPNALGLTGKSGVRSFVCNDFNGDGRPDLLAVGWTDPLLKSSEKLSWLSDWKDSRFALTSSVSGNFTINSSFWPASVFPGCDWGAVSVDLNLDGLADLAMATGGVTWSEPRKAVSSGYNSFLERYPSDSNRALTVELAESASSIFSSEIRRGSVWQPSDNSLNVYTNVKGEMFKSEKVPLLPGDGRSLVALDWNGDSRPDLALLGRGTPQLSLLLNESPANGLRLVLKGENAGRESAGAAIKLGLSDGRTLMFPITSGGNFLGQSSGAVFAGVEASSVTSVSVMWSGNEQFEKFKPASGGRRWVLQEGAGVARDEVPAKALTHNEAVREKLNPLSISRFYATGNEPILPLGVQNTKGDAFLLNDRMDRPTILVLFGSWDKAAVDYLKVLSDSDRRFRLEGARLIGICLDPVGRLSPKSLVAAEASKFVNSLNLPFFVGLVDDTGWLSLQLAHEVPRVLIHDLKPPSVWMVGSTGTTHLFYEGFPSVDDLLKDVKSYQNSQGNRWKRALPFAGRWLVPPETYAGPEMALALSNRQNYVEAWRFIQANKQHFGPSLSYARFLAELGVQLRNVNKFRESIQCFRDALDIAPNTPALMNNLAWVLLTAPDHTLRDPAEALRLAKLCNSGPEPIKTDFVDTYSVALAANDLIAEAIDASVRALESAKRENDENAIKEISHRLEVFRQGKSWPP